MSSDNKGTVELDRELVAKLLTHSHDELTRLRRNRIFNYFLKGGLFIGFFVLAYFIGGSNYKQGDKNEPHIAFVEIYGPIMSGQLADADRLIPALHNAFLNPLSKAVALRINSPGGSPVHAGRLYQEINILKEKYPEKKVFAVIEDLGASAAYYIASAADEIYVDQASMVGSIGVITSSFGYSKVMESVGIERRVLTAGTNKALLDPYLPSDAKVQTYWKGMLNEIHKQFITAVTEGRGDRLNTEYPELFSGLVWTGAKSVEIGLADDLGSLQSVSRDTIGKVNIVNYTPSPDWLKKLASQTTAQLTAIRYEALTPTLF
ncbi:MAG: S49 family peptidase [Pseudomonadales bacterium]|nr:S49 family peptidase [Pseudomonadales bacterium]